MPTIFKLINLHISTRWTKIELLNNFQSKLTDTIGLGLHKFQFACRSKIG